MHASTIKPRNAQAFKRPCSCDPYKAKRSQAQLSMGRTKGYLISREGPALPSAGEPNQPLALGVVQPT